MRKILQVVIKTIDENNHVKIWGKDDVDLDSIVFKGDKVVKTTPKKSESSIKTESTQEIKKKH